MNTQSTNTQPAKKQSAKTQCLFILVFLSHFFIGCASPNIDRSYVNDAQMSFKSSSGINEVSPLSGLNARSKAGGGNACSVCAQ